MTLVTLTFDDAKPLGYRHAGTAEFHSWWYSARAWRSGKTCIENEDGLFRLVFNIRRLSDWLKDAHPEEFYAVELLAEVDAFIHHVATLQHSGENPLAELGLAEKPASSPASSPDTWKKAVRDRCGNFCGDCGAKEELHVHHIKPKAMHPELALDPLNGEVLCSSCHRKRHAAICKLREWRDYSAKRRSLALSNASGLQK